MCFVASRGHRSYPILLQALREFNERWGAIGREFLRGRRGLKFDIEIGSTRIVVRHDLRNTIHDVDRGAMCVASENTQDVGRCEDFSAKVEGCFCVPGFRPAWSPLEFKVSIRVGTPVGMSAAESPRAAGREERDVESEYQRSASFDLRAQER